MDIFCKLGKKDCLFHGRISASCDNNLLVLKEWTIARRTVGNAPCAEFLFSFCTKFPWACTGGDNHGLCLVFLGIGQYLERPSSKIYIDYLIINYNCAHPLG